MLVFLGENQKKKKREEEEEEEVDEVLQVPLVHKLTCRDSRSVRPRGLGWFGRPTD